MRYVSIIPNFIFLTYSHIFHMIHANMFYLSASAGTGYFNPAFVY